MRIFVDSDVVISSLISSSGAAHFLIHNQHLTPVISSLSVIELERVIRRLDINPSKLKDLIQKRFELIQMTQSIVEIKKVFAPYVRDHNDAHIVAGAKTANVMFLITYNLKHFHHNKIKSDLHLLLMSPGIFLQYLRSQ